MVTAAGMIQGYFMLILVYGAGCFPDSAIGKKYILARTSSGYQLVPDGSKLAGIPVSAAVKLPQMKLLLKSKPQVSFPGCTL